MAECKIFGPVPATIKKGGGEGGGEGGGGGGEELVRNIEGNVLKAQRRLKES